MNFLAHFYLSQYDEELLVGNFLGDVVKGKKFEGLPEKVVLGIHMHREIDAFTDSHPIVLAGKSRLFEKYRHYSAVLIDMIYDYVLASEWTKHHNQSLEEFASWVYLVLDKYKYLYSERSNYLLDVMRENNWLVEYAEIEGMRNILYQMSQRTSFVSHLERGYQDILAYEKEFRLEFNSFFNEIKAVTQRKYK